MKALALIKRRDDHSRDAFRKHYEEIHAPLAIDTLLEGTTRYIRHHLRDEIYGEAGFDVVSAFWYRDVEAALAIHTRLASPAGEAILADELTFMDKPANTSFAVEERCVFGAEARDAGFAAIALVAAPEGAEVAAFLADYETRAIDGALAALRSPAWCLQQRAVAVGDAQPPFDALTQFHAAADAGLAQWAGELARDGARVLVVAVSEHESRLPAEWVAAHGSD